MSKVSPHLSLRARKRNMSKVSPHLSLRARKRNPDGAEFLVDVAARGWPAIADVALVALVAAFVLLRWLR